MLERGQIHASAAEAHPFRLQQKALLQGGFASQRYTSAGAQNALPGQAAHLPEDTADVARASRIACGLGDCAVSAHTSARHLANGSGNGGNQRLLCLRGHGIAQSASGSQQLEGDTWERTPEKVLRVPANNSSGCLLRADRWLPYSECYHFFDA